MNLSKRERVIRTLELDANIDKLPVHYLQIAIYIYLYINTTYSLI